MKFTIKQIDRCAAELQKLQNSKKHWPVKVNYAIAKNLKALLAEVEVYNAERTRLLKENALKDENGNAVLDEAKVKAYVVELAKKYDTFGYPRQFKTSTGETITVSGGDYGWLMARNDTTTKLKAESLRPLNRNIHIRDTYVTQMISEILMWKSAFLHSTCGFIKMVNYLSIQMS